MFYTLSTSHSAIPSNGVHTSAAPTLNILSTTNGFLSNLSKTTSIRTVSTDSTWNESLLPDKIRSLEEYKQLYSLSIKDPNRFWKMAAERLDWYHFPTIIKNTEFDYRTKRGVDIKWYEDGILNACYNCLDRHIENDHSNAQQIALIFEPDTPTESRYHVTYSELLYNVKKFANVLKKHGVKKGDRVTVYMPMVLETCVALLACARIGAIHSVVFGGFSANNVAERISDCDSTVVIIGDFGVRGGKCSSMKNKMDEALKMKQCSQVKTVLVFQRNHGMIELKDDCADLRETLDWTKGRDFWVHEEMDKVDENCEPERMNAEDPLFIVSKIKHSNQNSSYYY